VQAGDDLVAAEVDRQPAGLRGLVATPLKARKW